jgi:arylsulfatase A-like enzyme
METNQKHTSIPGEGIRLDVNRRQFVALAMGAGVATLLTQRILAQTGDRPNILWLTSEDNGPFLGAYDFPVAVTPNLDRMAAEGVTYMNAFSNAPVCAPSRFCIITGMYAPSFGPPQHMRAGGRVPLPVRYYPEYLREAGYYTTNNPKKDYNVSSKESAYAEWDDSSTSAHYNNRPPGKPFFSIFNTPITHEGASGAMVPNPTPPASVVARYAAAQTADPSYDILPKYHPDSEVFRQNWLAYCGSVSKMDEWIGERLAELDSNGLTEDTIVFYYSDHGGALSFTKRFCYQRGLHVPLIVKFPPRFAHLAPATPGSRIYDPVTLMDVGPTVISLAGISVPSHLHGRALAGPAAQPASPYVFNFRGRMDERYDMVRSVFKIDHAQGVRMHYVRNYMPHRIHGQRVRYMWGYDAIETVWRPKFIAGELNAAQSIFWRTKPPEELYDLTQDADEVNNLASHPSHQAILEELRVACENNILAKRDTGFMPEGGPYFTYTDAQNDAYYPLATVLPLANQASNTDPANIPDFVAAFASPHYVIRYWGAVGLAILARLVPSSHADLKTGPALASLTAAAESTTENVFVRMAAAEALCYLDEESRSFAAFTEGLSDTGPQRRYSGNCIDAAVDVLGNRMSPMLPALQAAATDEVGDLLASIIEKIQSADSIPPAAPTGLTVQPEQERYFLVGRSHPPGS